jgi:ABC-type sugar transport system ATPase subunit
MIRIERLHVCAGAFALNDISFEVPAGQYGVLMGKTGTGKTTILEAIAGLKSVVGGRILLDEADVTCRRPAERNVGLVPQDGALFTTMTVGEHLAFALVVRRWPQPAIDRRVGELAELLEIGPLLGRYPQGLSGGERQRVALGRALSFRPTTLCLDEPISALDDDTRGQIVELLGNIRRESPVTTLHITHNRHEADQLADLVFELVDGQIRQTAVRP